MTPAAEAAFRQGTAARLRSLRDAGVARAGWKVAINDPAAQRRLGLDGFLLGALRADRVLASGATWRAEAGARPAVEGELVLRVGRGVASDATPAAALAAIASIEPAIELVDQALPAVDLAGIVGHGVFHTAVVLGDAAAPATARPQPGEWPLVRRNGEVAARPAPSLDPGELGALVARAADLLARVGERLDAGDLLLSGSFTQPLPVQVGDEIVVDWGPLGTVALRFAR